MDENWPGDWVVGWWVTSALESNVGLNALAQWVANFRCRYAPGVGNGTVVYQQPGFSFKTTRRKIKL